MNASNGSSPVYDAQFYLKENGSVYITYFTLSTLGIVCGTIGNSVIIITILLNKKLRVNPAYMLMMNLSLSDLVISVFVHTFTVVGIYMGENFYSQRHGLCTMLAATCLIACGTSLVNMGILAVNRYINICRHGIYKNVFNLKKTIAFCVFAWIAGVVVDIPNFVGWGGHFFDPKSANCMWNRLASRSYSLFFATSAIFVPCLCIFVCYMRIFIFAFKSKSKVSCGHEMVQSLRVARSLFASFALFTVCWVPYGLIVSVDFVDEIPMSYHALSTLMAHINSALNPVLYLVFNPVFRVSFYEIIGGLCFNPDSRKNSLQWEKSAAIAKAHHANTSKLRLSVPNFQSKRTQSPERIQELEQC